MVLFGLINIIAIAWFKFKFNVYVVDDLGRLSIVR